EPLERVEGELAARIVDGASKRVSCACSISPHERDDRCPVLAFGASAEVHADRRCGDRGRGSAAPRSPRSRQAECVDNAGGGEWMHSGTSCLSSTVTSRSCWWCGRYGQAKTVLHYAIRAMMSTGWGKRFRM